MTENSEKEPVENAEASAANADETVQYKFTINLNPVKYAKRFGVEIPDDSADTGLTGDAESNEAPSDERESGSEREDGKTADGASEGEERAKDGADGLMEQDAEDANINLGKRMSGTMAGQCAATLAQCKAKNPLTCRFHGAKAIAQDIEGLLRQQGVQGQVEVTLQNVSKSGQKELLSCEVVVTGTKKEEKLVTAAMKAFANMPGVDSVEAGDYGGGKKIYTGFDIDILDPNAQAKWAAGQQPPQQPTQQQAPAPKPQPKPAPAPAPKPAPQPKPAPAPATAPKPTPAPQPSAPATPAPAPVATTANGPKLHPPVRPEEPPPFNGITDDEGEFLEGVGLDLAFLAQRVNHNLSKNPPTPGAGTIAAQKFAAIDGKKLDELAKKDSSGQAAVIKSVFDAAKSSEKNGWGDKIEAPGYAYDESQYDSGDPSKSTGYEKWKFDMSKCPQDPHAKARKAWKEWEEPSKKRANDVSVAGTVLNSTDADAPKNEAQQLIDADKDMKDIEDTIGVIDKALKKEKDPTASQAIRESLDEIEVVYAAKSKEFEDAKRVVSDYIKNQVNMAPGASCADIAKKLAAQGLYVPPLLLTADAALKSHSADAQKRRAADIKAAGGLAKAEQNFANNIRAMWDSDDVEVLINTDISTVIGMLKNPKKGTRNGRYESAGLDGDYVNLGKYNFGTTYKNPQEQHKYGAFFQKGSSGQTAYGHCCVVLNKKKVVGFIGGPHSCTRGTGSSGRTAVMPNKPSLTGYWGGSLVTQDMSKGKNAGSKILQAFGSSPEFWIAGDVTRETIGTLRVHPGDVAAIKRDAEAVAFIKRVGLEVVAGGKKVQF